MKPFLDVEANRVEYHKYKNKNTVHRSSLIVPRFEQATSNISFINHFLLKRSNSNIALKITAINKKGLIKDSISIEINELKVYTFNLESLFEKASDIIEYLVEFYSDKNLFIPFPAVIINHIGSDFVNTVHSYNRVLNDIFEDDKVNQQRVYESSVDVSIDGNYDTFFNFATGPFKVKSNLQISLSEEDKNSKKIPIKMERLTNKNIFLSTFYKSCKKKIPILKILQPEQSLFYGRLFIGKINKKTKAFSANHSYYDSSSTKEYFNNKLSMRTYPFFNNCLNKLVMYPIMSPSNLKVLVEIYSDGETFRSPFKAIKSPSNNPVAFDINAVVKKSGFTNVSLFKVIATSTDSKIPTRVNHQLIYGDKDSKSKLQSSINVSLINDNVYNAPSKKGFTWGQVLINKSFESRLGICFNDNSGETDEVSIDFYTKSGLFKSLKKKLNPNNSLIFKNDFFNRLKFPNEFVWFVAKSNRPDLQAESFHYHLTSGNASGEHSF
jgi:hypothetical protein